MAFRRTRRTEVVRYVLNGFFPGLLGAAPQVEEYYHAAHQKYVPLHQHFRVPDEVYYKRTETTTEDLPNALTRVCACAYPGLGSVCQLLSLPHRLEGAVRLRGRAGAFAVHPPKQQRPPALYPRAFQRCSRHQRERCGRRRPATPSETFRE